MTASGLAFEFYVFSDIILRDWDETDEGKRFLYQMLLEPGKKGHFAPG
jgi:hypothetical protein